MQSNPLHRSLLVLAAFFLGTWATDSAVAQKPLASAHAHNDYEHDRPLYDALDHGFCSVEADIWLAPEGLLVAHDRKDLKPKRTLQSLYLDPLRKLVETNGGSVFAEGPSFYLLVDVKTEAESTYKALDAVLAQYADILTATKNGKVDRKAVTVILSGNRAFETIAKQPVHFVGIDGRPENLDANPPADLYPWISANWTLLFKWKGEGPFPTAEKEKLRAMVQQTHGQHRKLRFWATAETEAMWKALLAAGVDYINTDRLDEFQKFLLAQKP